MWTGSVSPVMRQKAKGIRPARNKARRAARRVVLPGYPVEPRPFTLIEVRDYFAGDKIVCLRCGKAYKRLAVHLQNIHGMTEEDYKGMYGLPWRRGLTSDASHRAYSASIDREAAAIRRQEHPTWHLMRGAPRRPFQMFRRELCMNNLQVIKREAP